MRTPVCELVGCELPVFAFSHCRDVVAAVTRAGGYGVLGASTVSPEQLEVELAWLDEHTDGRSYGVDVLIPTTYDARAQRPTDLNGKLPILSFQQVIDIARAKSAALGRTLTVYPESKNPYWNNAQAIANGCGPAGSHPFEDAILKVMRANDLDRKDAPILVQSFDPASLKYLRSAGMKARAVQLVDGNDIDFRTGEMIYVTDDAYTFVDGRPYSWTLAGDPRFFGAMLTPAGLAEIATYADGVGPWKPQVMAHTIVPFKPAPYKGTLAEVTHVTPTALIADAHRAGLFVHSYTFRNEPQYLAGVYKGDPAAEYQAYFAAGIDGVFTDFAHTGFAARKAYLAGTGR